MLELIEGKTTTFLLWRSNEEFPKNQGKRQQVKQNKTPTWGCAKDWVFVSPPNPNPQCDSIRR